MTAGVDPLEALLAALAAGGPIPFEWVVAHARDGTIQAAWDACQDATRLLRVYAHAKDREGLVRAACACARTALCVPRVGGLALLAIEAAEAWARGEATVEQVRRAAQEADDDVHATTTAAEMAATAAIAAALTAVVSGSVSTSNKAADAVYYSVDSYSTAFGGVKAARLRELAKIVRATIPCPALDQLTAR